MRQEFLCVFVILAFAGCGEAPQDAAVSPRTSNGTSVSHRQGSDTDRAGFEFSHPTFEAPVMLMADGKPMQAGHSYPSPGLFDVDDDGDDEMVLGEIMGSVSYCENTNAGSGDPVWGPVKELMTADNKPLKLNNW